MAKTYCSQSTQSKSTKGNTHGAETRGNWVQPLKPPPCGHVHASYSSNNMCENIYQGPSLETQDSTFVLGGQSLKHSLPGMVQNTRIPEGGQVVSISDPACTYSSGSMNYSGNGENLPQTQVSRHQRGPAFNEWGPSKESHLRLAMWKFFLYDGLISIKSGGSRQILGSTATF